MYRVADPTILSCDCKHWDRITDSSQIWIGEVSWLKAAIFGDDKYIPEPVEALAELIGEDLPILDDALMAKILQALMIKRNRANSYYVVVNSQTHDVTEWLAANYGMRLFTVSW